MDMHLEAIFTDGQLATHSKGRTILNEHSKRDHVFYVQSGWVKVAQNLNTPSEKILTTLHNGNIFPFEWSHTEACSVSFVALEETKTLSMPIDVFKKKILANPDFADSVIHIVTLQNQNLINEITNLQYHTAREKIILRLLSLAKDFGQVKGSSVYINKNITNEYMSKSTSMSRETTSREMSRLIRERLIRHTSKSTTLVDINILKEIINKQKPRTYHHQPSHIYSRSL
jgi:CRP/FNR family cyclic AMP-dependent transcriptional regulator